MEEKTRRDRAQDLMRLLSRGPDFHPVDFQLLPGETAEKNARKKYNIWFESYVHAEIVDLIPELRDW